MKTGDKVYFVNSYNNIPKGSIGVHKGMVRDSGYLVALVNVKGVDVKPWPRDIVLIDDVYNEAISLAKKTKENEKLIIEIEAALDLESVSV